MKIHTTWRLVELCTCSHTRLLGSSEPVEVALLARAHLASGILSGCFVTESHSLELFVPPGEQPQMEPRKLITLVLMDLMGASANRTMLVRTVRYHAAVGVGKA